ncbi:folate transporter/carrier [Thecamonas trahens ATCC 50062]|uniref:Folate transporter/carrier n=1 Tax=Thecamonas trahens ATCC 50062 TaxID=461836 RepID=A0A0L0DRI0_THETB|nr:folate transporter/carrier [Thecamonas trahens ATCC 50062]KNC54053.1 folate transporter/carrier [Thecamonas trahens ATCC 50062]|eukprot:XP_013754064.1 folate transporter/carrier [Thecamonas trahens ATCC 50062]
MASETKAPIHAVAGVVAGMSATMSTYPLDLVKTKFQVHDGTAGCKYPRYASTWDALVQISRKHGLRGLYSGLSPNLVGSGMAWGLYFLSYTRLKEAIREERGLAPGTPLGPGWHMGAATAAGLATCLVTNPIWLVKTRMQLQLDDPTARQYRGVVHAIRTIAGEEGIRGLYRGLGPSLIGVSHGAFQFMAYEELKKLLLYSPLYDAKIRLLPRWMLSDAVDVSSTHSARDLSTYEALAVGALSKMFASIVSYPYQVIRARLQIQTEVDRTARRYTSALHAFRSIIASEGVSGLYKGLVPTVLRVMPGACVTFAVYERVSQLLLKLEGDAAK